jgi:hypothetical protein
VGWCKQNLEANFGPFFGPVLRGFFMGGACSALSMAATPTMAAQRPPLH